MRQSSTLPLSRLYPRTVGLCRWLSAPAGRRTFPTFSLRLFPCVLGPLPRWLLRCIYPFLPQDIGLPPVRTGSALHNVRTATSVRRPFRGCSHSRMFRPAGVLTTPVAPPATAYAVWQPWFLRPSLSWFVTSPRPGYACRPHRAIDGRGLSPHQMRSLVGCSPNAGPQAPPKAGARDERSNCLDCQGGLCIFFSSVPPGVRGDLPVLQHGVENGQELVPTRGQGDFFLTFPAARSRSSGKALICGL